MPDVYVCPGLRCAYPGYMTCSWGALRRLREEGFIPTENPG
ncbi:hypothetical protein SB6413_00419 [Klebsiella pasteurii]|nr:hypothetical protein SB6413_00419 [Klebsiella pasteurii]